MSQRKFNINEFLKRVHKYLDIIELTPQVLHEFIDKIVVHHREKLHGEVTQKLEVYYKTLRQIEAPYMSKRKKESCVKYFGNNKKDRSA